MWSLQLRSHYYPKLFFDTTSLIGRMWRLSFTEDQQRSAGREIGLPCVLGVAHAAAVHHDASLFAKQDFSALSPGNGRCHCRELANCPPEPRDGRSRLNTEFHFGNRSGRSHDGQLVLQSTIMLGPD